MALPIRALILTEKESPAIIADRADIAEPTNSCPDADMLSFDAQDRPTLMDDPNEPKSRIETDEETVPALDTLQVLPTCRCWPTEMDSSAEKSFDNRMHPSQADAPATDNVDLKHTEDVIERESDPVTPPEVERDPPISASDLIERSEAPYTCERIDTPLPNDATCAKLRSEDTRTVPNALIPSAA